MRSIRPLLLLLLAATTAHLDGLRVQAGPQGRPAPVGVLSQTADAAQAPDIATSAGPTAAMATPPQEARLSLSDRAFGLAADVNRLLSPAAALQASDAEAGTDSEDGKVKSLLQKALALLGTPYRWGGTDPDKGFDCSGLVGYVFRNALGVELPRVSRDMARTGQLVTERAKLAAGDLVFFGRRGRVDHVGIYVGEGRFVHAPSTGGTVRLDHLDGPYWRDHYSGARRVLE